MNRLTDLLILFQVNHAADINHVDITIKIRNLETSSEYFLFHSNIVDCDMGTKGNLGHSEYLLQETQEKLVEIKAK